MKVLVVGDWHSELHEEVVQRGLSDLDHEVVGFKWHGYFALRAGWLGRVWHYFQRAQDKFVAGPLIGRINRDLVACATRQQPDMIFIYRGTHVTARTLDTIRRRLPTCVLVGYNNDDPFAPNQPRYLWRHFLAAVPQYDLVLAYRHHNLDEFRRIGARRVELMRSWFVPWRNHPVTMTESDRAAFECDVVFVGHFESDQRMSCLEAIARKGLSLRLFGPTKYWAAPLAASPEISHLNPVRMVWGEDYNRALCGAKIALCFFSKLNRDTYTRRCFEIPATKTLMLSERSGDLASMFREDEEIVFFSSPDELVEKIESLLRDDVRRQRIAEAGYRRVVTDGHDVLSRMKILVEQVEQIQMKKGQA